MTGIDALQQRVGDALQALAAMHDQGTLPPVLEPLLAIAPPRGARPIVELHRGPRDPDGSDGGRLRGRVEITYAPNGDARPRPTGGRDPLADLIRVVDEAEANPQLKFVALKFLRDRLLPESGLVWARFPPSCQGTIADGIDRGVLRTAKKANPRNPEFPVTAVELVRDHPMVAEVLGRTTRPRGEATAAEG